MRLNGLHLLLTYRCLLECEHCFVWAGPTRNGVMTIDQVRRILGQADELGTIETIFFEGGEPFLHYAVLLAGARIARDRGYRVGVVTSAYWAANEEDAEIGLAPFRGLLDVLQLSDDRHHGDAAATMSVEYARRAAEAVGISTSAIRIAQPEDVDSSSLMYRGRAAEMLAPRAKGRPWEQFTECPHEDLLEPGRVHVDHFGNVQICQGISIGNLFETPLREICEAHTPSRNPILRPLIEGGPAALVREYDLPHDERPADACHLCYDSRRRLRKRFPEILTPGQVYGAIA